MCVYLSLYTYAFPDEPLAMVLDPDCFWNYISETTDMGALGNNAKQSIFTIWLARPNHYGRKLCMEILCRIPVSKSKISDLESKSI